MGFFTKLGELMDKLPMLDNNFLIKSQFSLDLLMEGIIFTVFL